MKKLSITAISTITVLLAIVFPTCAFGAPAHDGGAEFARDVEKTEWILSEFRVAGKTVQADRRKFEANNMGGIYTITFEEDKVNGMGAPNRYFGPYQAGDNNALTLQPVGSTMMAAIVTDPQRITAPPYFQYLSKVKSWKVNQNKLELTGSDTANKPLTMVFSN
jgi:heat shock protein HslJ